MRDLWVDFNDVELGDEIETLVSFATDGRSFVVGETVVVGDDDGTTCQASVVANDGQVVRVRLDRATLRHPADTVAARPPAKSA